MKSMKNIAIALLVSSTSLAQANLPNFTVTIVDHDVDPNGAAGEAFLFRIEAQALTLSNEGILYIDTAPQYTSMILDTWRETSNLRLTDASIPDTLGCNWTEWSMDAEGNVSITTDPNDESCGDPEYPWPVFRDVYSFHWAYDYVQALTNAGITSGCEENFFCPNEPVSRAQMAIFLEKGISGSNYTPAAAQGNLFDDVPASYWAAAWIEQLALDEITAGCDSSNFCPENMVLRSEMAPLILRAIHLGEDPVYTPVAATGETFTDVPADYWAADWIEALADEGITIGCGDGIYCPEDSVTRAQMATFLTRAFQLNQ